jgi:hypothetical protein
MLKWIDPHKEFQRVRLDGDSAGMGNTFRAEER